MTGEIGLGQVRSGNIRSIRVRRQVRIDHGRYQVRIGHVTGEIRSGLVTSGQIRLDVRSSQVRSY